MTKTTRAGDPPHVERLRAEARRLAREIALRHPQSLALACARADPAAGPGLAAAWCDMIRAGEIDILATPLAELVTLLCVMPGETRGPLRRRLSQLATLAEDLIDAEIAAIDAAEESEAQAA